MIAIPHPVQSAALARPDHPALLAPTGALTWAGLRDRVVARAAALARDGVAPGEVVALVAPAGQRWWVDFWALGWLGAAVAPINAEQPPAARAAAIEAVGARRVIDGALADVAPGDPQPERPWPLDEVRLVLATSGTTGRPRPVPLTTAQIVFSAFGSAIRLGHDPADRWLACLPPHHVGGVSIGLRCALYGTTVDLLPRFEPAAVAARLDAGEVTLASLTPSMLAAVLDARPDTPFPPRLRAILLGGARTPPALLARCRMLGAPIARTWGMTEAASQVATCAPGDLAPGAPPLPFARVSAREDGALLVDGPLVAAPLATGDRGRVEGGRVFVEGRRDDVIVSGGVNLDPAAIEDALRGHPAVADAAVIGLDDPTWGARPAAALVPAGHARPALDALRAHCRARLPAYAAPDRVAWVEALPRDPLGKLRRRALSALFATPEPEKVPDA